MKTTTATVGILLFIFVFSTRPAAADQVVVAGKNFPNAKIVALDGGRLQFRAADGTLTTAWIDEIELMLVERSGAFADINEAERLVSKGDVDNALLRYRRAARISEGFWGELTDARILRACGRPERIDQAALSFVKLARGKATGPGAACRLIPAKLPTERDAKSASAIEILESALLREPTTDQQTAFELFRFAILRSLSDGRAKNSSQNLMGKEIPAAARCDRVYTILMEAISLGVSDGADAPEIMALDSLIRDCPSEMLPSALLLKGDTLLKAATTREENIRASWPFLRVAIHAPDDPRAADGLYGASISLERIGRADLSAALLRECVANKRIGVETRKRAEVALARLQSSRGAAFKVSRGIWCE